MTEGGMNKRQIGKNLFKRFNDFADSIEDEEVKSLVLKNTIITGGCIASMMLGEKVNDYDLYFTNRKTTLAVANYYVKRAGIGEVIEEKDRISIEIGIGEEGGKEIEYEENEEEPKPFRPIYISPNAITLSDDIQIVVRFFGSAKQIHENFDFVHATNYWKSSNGKLYLRKDAMESLLCKNLRYVGSKYPVCSVVRMRKFISRGWVINAGQVLKILIQVSELDLLNPTVLREQLIGIDTSYFVQVLEMISSNEMEKVDAAYLTQVIDEVFE